MNTPAKSTRSPSLVFLLVVVLFSWLLALQGWKSRKPAFDMLVYFNNAETFLHHGTFPQYGDISSYGSFSPPGTSWLFLPGELMFHDPRLVEKAGSLLLHFGTVLGVFLLADKIFTRRVAVLAVLLYALSSIGLSYAGSLWPIGHPVFYVWIAYFACLWASRRDARFFAAALLVFGIGMYVDMAITPSILVLPVIWLLYRRSPVFSLALLPAGLIVLFVWYPYLRFEAGRSFVDIRSQLLRFNISSADAQSAWCNPNLQMQSLSQEDGLLHVSLPAAPPAPGAPGNLYGRITNRLAAIKDGLLANFMEGTPSIVGSLVLLLILLSSTTLLGLYALQSGLQENPSQRPLLQGRASGLFQRLSKVRLLAAAPDIDVEQAGILTLCLAVPWAVLLLVAEPGRSERFLWLWPLQAILLAAAVIWLPRQVQRMNRMRWVYWTAAAGLFALTTGVTLLTSFQTWARTGWSGADAEEVQAARILAQDMQSKGLSQASIGYQVYFYPFMARYHSIDPQYKVGAEFDILFTKMFGISNDNQCGEGFSPQDDYRIVQVQREPGVGTPENYFDIPLREGYRLVGQTVRYKIYELK